MYKAGESKIVVRDHAYKFLNSCSYILTLPNLYFDLEEKFLADGKKVDCVERERSIFEIQQSLAPRKITLFNSDVRDIDVTKYDGIFLDLCGTFGISAMTVLNKLTSGTKIVLTLMMARESKELQKFINLKKREDSYIRLLGLYNIEVKTTISYNDTSPMSVFFGIKT